MGDSDLSPDDAQRLEGFRRGGPVFDPFLLSPGPAQDIYRAMAERNGDTRDEALARYLDTLSIETRNGIQQALLSVDVAAPDRQQIPFLAAKSPGGDADAVPALPPVVLNGATPEEFRAQYEHERGEVAGQALDTCVQYLSAVEPMSHPLFYEAAGLWLASVAIARRLVLRTPYGEVYPNLFILLIATTTVWHKSSVLDLAQRTAQEVYPHLLAPQNSTTEALIADMAGAEPTNFAVMSEGERQEWMAERNFAAQRGLRIDELSGLLAGAGRDYNAGLIEMLLRFYDCEPRYVRSTRTAGRVAIRNACLSLLGASTPAALRQHLAAERLWAMGWWARFALLTPDRERAEWARAEEREFPSELMTTLTDLYGRLPRTEWPSTPDPICVMLGSSVFDDHERYSRAMHELIGPALPERLAGVYGRLPGQVLKVAIILAALDWPRNREAPTVERHHWARAVEIVERWRASAHRLVTVTQRSAGDQLADRILSLLPSYGPQGATVREAHRRMSGADTGQIRVALEGLERDGLVARVHVVPSARGGRPTERFVAL